MKEIFWAIHLGINIILFFVFLYFWYINKQEEDKVIYWYHPLFMLIGGFVLVYFVLIGLFLVIIGYSGYQGTETKGIWTNNSEESSV